MSSSTRNGPAPRVSVIVCTCDRVPDLERTLCAMEELRVPVDLPAELIVVDNSRTGSARTVVDRPHLPFVNVRSIPEPRRGLSRARNTGIAAALGQIILFTDDDVRVPADWIEAMCRPIADGRADAVAGRIRMAPHLERPWMTAWHRSALAARSEDSLRETLVGANMAFARRVLERVPQFDPALGPGALGFADDTLFALQLADADYRLVVGDNLGEVEHHFATYRLTRIAFLDSAEQRGRSKAYLAHHWKHEQLGWTRVRLMRAHAALVFARLLGRRYRDEGIGLGEYLYHQRVSFLRQYRIERRRARVYARNAVARPRRPARGSAATAPALR